MMYRNGKKCDDRALLMMVSDMKILSIVYNPGWWVGRVGESWTAMALCRWWMFFSADGKGRELLQFVSPDITTDPPSLRIASMT